VKGSIYVVVVVVNVVVVVVVVVNVVNVVMFGNERLAFESYCFPFVSK
jgi:hypothetical protein